LSCAQLFSLFLSHVFRIMPLLRDLHWLRVGQRVEFKLAVLVYRCLNGQRPPYLASDLHSVDNLDTRWCLRSSSLTRLPYPSRASPPLATALFLWRRLGCGTACQPLWPRHHRCQRLRGTWRLNCSPEAMLYDSFGRVWQFLVRSTVSRTFKTFSELCSVSSQSTDSTPP